MRSWEKQKNRKNRGLGDIREAETPKESLFGFRARSSVVNLKPSWHKQYRFFFSAALMCGIFGVFFAGYLLTRAELAIFYPASCLGTWQEPRHAEGEPETFMHADTIFGENNSAVFNGNQSQIFCGAFISETHEAEGSIVESSLTLVWKIDEEQIDSAPPDVLEDVIIDNSLNDLENKKNVELENFENTPENKEVQVKLNEQNKINTPQENPSIIKRIFLPHITFAVNEGEIENQLTSTSLNVLLENNGEKNEFTTQANESREWEFNKGGELKRGAYTITAVAVDARGAISYPSEPITLIVRPSLLLTVGTFTVNLLAVLIPIVALLMLLLATIWYGWHKFSLFRKNVQKQIRTTEHDLHTIFDALKDDVRKQIDLLEKARRHRTLTKEEEEIAAKLKEDLAEAEHLIKEEIKDIGSE